MPIQLWVDESGGRGQGPVFALAGLMAKAEDWADFSDMWSERLKEPRRIEYFKMREAAKFIQQFDGFSVTERDHKLRRLADAINQLAPTEVHCMVNLDGFADLIVPRTRPPFNDPYFWAFGIIIGSAGKELLAKDHREVFEIIFDENVISGLRAQAWYPLARKISGPEAHAILPPDVTFRSDKEWMPLQASDLMAWSYRRSNSGENPFEWLQGVLDRVTPSDHSQRLSPAVLREFIAASEAPEVQEVLNQIFGPR